MGGHASGCPACGDELGQTLDCAPCRAFSVASLRWRGDQLIVDEHETPLPDGVCWSCGSVGEFPAEEYPFTRRPSGAEILDVATHHLSRLLVKDLRVSLAIPTCGRCYAFQLGFEGWLVLLAVAGLAAIGITVYEFGQAMLAGDTSMRVIVPAGLLGLVVVLTALNAWSERRRITCVHIVGSTATIRVPRAARIREVLAASVGRA